MFKIAAMLALLGMAMAQTFPAPPCYIYGDDKIEAPCAADVKNGTAYSVRVYGASTESEFWSTARITGSYSDAQAAGFQKNFEYITGANSAKQDIPMTHPVLARSNGTDATQWQISFFVPSAFSKSASDIPTPTDSAVTIEKAPLMKIAYGEFPGFATEDDFVKCEANLRTALAADGVKLMDGTEWSRSWSQYDSPFTLFDRHNECWLRIE